MHILYRLLRVSTFKGRLRLWVGALIVTMCLVIMLFLFLLLRVIKERETHAALQEAINLQCLFIDKWKSERLADIQYLANIPATRALDFAEMRRQFDKFRETHAEFRTISFVNAQGQLSAGMAGPPDTDVSDRDYFQAAKRNEPFVTDVMLGRASNLYLVAFTAPVLDNRGEFAGVIVGTVELTTLDNIMGRFRLGESGQAYLLDKEGYRITQSRANPEAPRMTERHRTEIFERAMNGVKDSSSYPNREGVPVFGAYAWTEDRKWILVGEMSSAEVYKPYYDLLKAMIALTCVILAASYVVTVLLTKRMEKLLHHLLRGTKKIRAGEYGYKIDESIIRSAPSELKELSENFNIMSEKLQSTVLLLEESAVLDPLTEVYNRRFLMNEGAKIEEAAARAGNPSCILLIDVDYFKQINDTYGHLVGDRVLKHAASLLTACVRLSDVVARFGGEEFVVLATNCELESGRELAERIRTWFANSPYRDEEREIAISVSIGVAQSSPNRTYGTNTLEDMIERADKALYRAKNRGRNRVEVDVPVPMAESAGKPHGDSVGEPGSGSAGESG